MKTLDFKIFEKLNIIPIDTNVLNDIDITEYVTKKSLKTFDIVQIIDKKYMVFRHDDAKKYFKFFKLAQNIHYANVFVRTNSTNPNTTPCIQLFNNFLDNLKYWSDDYKKFDIKNVWLFKDTDFNEYDSNMQMIDLTQYAIDSYIKKYDYIHLKINENS